MRGSYRHFVLLSPWYCNRLVSLDFLQCSLCDIMSGISLKISQSPKSSFETRTSHSNAWRILEKLYFLNGGPLSYKFENRFAPRSRYTHFLWTGAGCFAIFCALRLPLRISRNGILSSITWCFWIVHEFYLTVDTREPLQEPRNLACATDVLLERACYYHYNLSRKDGTFISIRQACCASTCKECLF